MVINLSKNLENLTYFESIEDKEYAQKFEMLDYEIGLEERLSVLNETQKNVCHDEIRRVFSNRNRRDTW